MSLPVSFLGIVFALTSACVWGGGDFCGGLAARRNNQFQVLVLSALSGIVLLVVCAALRQEALPSLRGAGFAMLAGLFGALGIAALYRALSMGFTASVAPTAAVIGAALPVAFSALTESLAPVTRMAGFGLAFLGIWLLSQSTAGEKSVSRQGLLLAVLAGVGFGGFFILVAQANFGQVFTPLIITRSVTLLTGLLLVRVNRLPLPGLKSNPVALLAGLLDAGGNVFFVLAKQFTRLDVAAVLSSLYLALTVILASIVLKEKVTRGQWIGLVVCLAATVMITL